MFNKENFSKTLKKINSTYSSMTEFAQKASFDRTYISKYINMKLDNPPTPKILEKIANASNGVVTYNELMIMCGYLKDETTNYINLSKELAKSKAYLDCYNLLSSTNLSETEINKLLYNISTMEIEENGNDEDKLKEMLSSIFQDFPKGHKELVSIVLTQYWQNVLKYRQEAVKFLKNNSDNKDIQDFYFAYHKEMAGLTPEEVADALRFYKEMKKRVEKDKK